MHILPSTSPSCRVLPSTSPGSPCYLSLGCTWSQTTTAQRSNPSLSSLLNIVANKFSRTSYGYSIWKSVGCRHSVCSPANDSYHLSRGRSTGNTSAGSSTGNTSAGSSSSAAVIGKQYVCVCAFGVFIILMSCVLYNFVLRGSLSSLSATVMLNYTESETNTATGSSRLYSQSSNANTRGSAGMNADLYAVGNRIYHIMNAVVKSGAITEFYIPNEGRLKAVNSSNVSSNKVDSPASGISAPFSSTSDGKNLPTELPSGASLYVLNPRPMTPGKPSPTSSVPKISAISLIVPCERKHWKYLLRLLHSTAHQSLKPLETIVVLSDAAELNNEGASNDSDKIILSSKIVNRSIPNLRLYVVDGLMTPGQNRIFGAQRAKGDIIAFFDCDDYMHRQRIDIMQSVFDANSSIEALLHTLNYGNEEKAENHILNFNRAVYAETDGRLPYTTKELFERLPTAEALSEAYSVPTTQTTDMGSTSSRGVFPNVLSLMNLNRLAYRPSNGWLTIRKSTLQHIEYPSDLAKGEDSTYVYRLIKGGISFNILDLPLGLYIRPPHLYERVKDKERINS